MHALMLCNIEIVHWTEILFTWFDKYEGVVKTLNKNRDHAMWSNSKHNNLSFEVGNPQKKGIFLEAGPFELSDPWRF